MQQLSNVDFINVARILNLPPAQANGQPVTYEQLLSAIESLAWKDDTRVRAQVNVTLSAPGANIDGEAMNVGDTFLASVQTTGSENGKYVWNGAAVPATRSLDMSASIEFNSAIVPITSGTDAGKVFRCSNVNPVVGTDTINFSSVFTGAAAASETNAGVAEIATQAEVDAGVDALRFITPATLAASAYSAKRFAANFGDGVANSFAITHNFGNADLIAQVRRVSDNAVVEIDQVNTNANTITLTTAAGIIPTTNQYRCVVIR